jgi:hypothetical protein
MKKIGKLTNEKEKISQPLEYFMVSMRNKFNNTAFDFFSLINGDVCKKFKNRTTETSNPKYKSAKKHIDNPISINK